MVRIDKETTMKRDRVIKIGLWAVLLIYGVLCVYLYYRQTLHVSGTPYESDLSSHIRTAVNQHWFYSFLALLYQLFYMTPFGGQLTAVFLGVVTIGTIYVTYRLFQELLSQYNIKDEVLLLFALLCNIAMPFYVWIVQGSRYIGYQSATIWHNPTYICMKFFGVISALYYLRLEKKYRQGLTWKEWVTMALLFAVTTLVKPNFLMVFAPAMAIFLLADLIKRENFRNIFIFGLTVLPSLLVILWQSVILFGADTGNGIEIHFGYTFTRFSQHPIATLLLSIVFPLYVLLFAWKELLRDRGYLFSWVVWGIGLLMVTFLTETGERAGDGNFLWGYYFGIFLILIYSIKKLLEKRFLRHGAYLVGLLFLGYQCYCGIVFFVRLCLGEPYYM